MNPKEILDLKHVISEMKKKKSLNRFNSKLGTAKERPGILKTIQTEIEKNTQKDKTK